MSSVGYDMHREPKANSKKAAVLLLLYRNETGDHNIVFIKRPSNNPHDKHGGQISFPGGQVEHNDRDLEYTALRETYEEIGIPIDQLNVLGALSSIYVFVSDFLVFPYIAYLESTPQFIPQASEVDRIISWPVKDLLHAPPLTKDLQIRNINIKNVPYYDLKGETLWGATAMITSEFLEILKKHQLTDL